jgi:4-hydroxybenzoate polyprenyltransferase
LTRLVDYIKSYYRVCRLEYLPGEVPAIFTVLFLGAASITRFSELPVVEALLAFVLLYLSGFIINALADKEIDKNYDTFKTSIPKSVETLGEKTLWAMIFIHVGVAIGLAVHISILMSSIWPITLVLIGAFFGLGYSVRPFHFKVRGVWHAIALGSSAFFLPFIFLMFVVAEGITIPLFIFIIGFCFIHYGMEFGNQAIDYVEDKASDVKTPPVRWGMIPSIQIALFCVVIGIAIEASSLYFILLSKGSFTFIHAFLTTEVVYAGLLTIIAAGYYIPTKGLWRMLITLKESDTVEEGMPTLKKICKYAKWQASGILGVAVVSGILFFGVVFGPVSTMTPDNQESTNIMIGNLEIVSSPEVEFYEDDSGCYANVSISVLNDDNERQMGSIMILLESYVAKFPIPGGIEPVLLERDLKPFAYWNTSATVRAHEVDDTTLEITLIALVVQNSQTVMHPVDTVTLPSQKDLYIYEVEIEYYDDNLLDKKANVTVNIYNQEENWHIGDLKVEVHCYTSLMFWTDSGEEWNKQALYSNQYWDPVVRDLNIIEFEIDDPIFHIKLISIDEIEGNQLIDDLWVVTKS